METETIRQLSIHELFANPNFDKIEKNYRAGSNDSLVRKGMLNKEIYLSLDNEDPNSDLSGHFTFGIFSGELVQGFVISFVSYYAHLDQKVIFVDSLYLEPEFRRHGNGDKLLQAVFDKAKEVGIKEVCFSAPYNSRLAKVFARKYFASDIQFVKVVE